MYLLKNAAPKNESLKKVQKLLAHVMTFDVPEMAPKWPQNGPKISSSKSLFSQAKHNS